MYFRLKGLLILLPQNLTSLCQNRLFENHNALINIFLNNFNEFKSILIVLKSLFCRFYRWKILFFTIFRKTSLINLKLKNNICHIWQQVILSSFLATKSGTNRLWRFSWSYFRCKWTIIRKVDDSQSFMTIGQLFQKLWPFRYWNSKC